MQTKIKKIGIIAGNNKLPLKVQEACVSNNIEYVVAFIGQDESYKLYDNNKYCHRFALGEVGKILTFFKSNQISHVVLAGDITKPSFSKVKVDFKGALLLAKILKNRMFGDNSILTEVIKYIEQQGLKILSAVDIADGITLSPGCITNVQPSEKQIQDILLGFEVLNGMSSFDIGQSVIIEDGVIIALEAIEGTDELILRSRKLLRANNGILVKSAKKEQDLRVDMPTIGPNTITNMNLSKIKGLAIKSGTTIVIEKDEMIRAANDAGMFIYIV